MGGPFFFPPLLSARVFFLRILPGPFRLDGMGKGKGCACSFLLSLARVRCVVLVVEPEILFFFFSFFFPLLRLLLLFSNPFFLYLTIFMVWKGWLDGWDLGKAGMGDRWMMGGSGTCDDVMTSHRHIHTHTHRHTHETRIHTMGKKRDMYISLSHMLLRAQTYTHVF